MNCAEGTRSRQDEGPNGNSQDKREAMGNGKDIGGQRQSHHAAELHIHSIQGPVTHDIRTPG